MTIMIAIPGDAAGRERLARRLEVEAGRIRRAAGDHDRPHAGADFVIWRLKMLGAAGSARALAALLRAHDRPFPLEPAPRDDDPVAETRPRRRMRRPLSPRPAPAAPAPAAETRPGAPPAAAAESHATGASEPAVVLPARRYRIADVVARAAAAYGLERSALTGESLKKAIVKPRQIAMWAASRLTGRSMLEIGIYFGGRDHTTVIHAVRTISAEVAAGSALGREAEAFFAGFDTRPAVPLGIGAVSAEAVREAAARDAGFRETVDAAIAAAFGTDAALRYWTAWRLTGASYREIGFSAGEPRAETVERAIHFVEEAVRLDSALGRRARARLGAVLGELPAPPAGAVA